MVRKGQGHDRHEFNTVRATAKARARGKAWVRISGRQSSL